MTTILFATDFSPSSEAASQITTALAHHLGARVVCTHAVAPFRAGPEPGAGSAEAIDAIDVGGFHAIYQKEMTARAQRLQQLADELARHGIQASARLLDGSAGPVVEAICAAAGDTHAAPVSLVILGSHGRTGLSRLLLGSVAERVVRLCSTSVLVARAPVIDRAGFRRVLVPTDFTEAAEVALDQAATLAAPDAVIDVLHCWQVDEFSDGLVEAADTHEARGVASRHAAERARHLGEAMVRRLAGGQRKVAFHLREGRPTSCIHDFIEEQAAPYDLVAVGTHGRTGVQRLLVGSVAEYTVRYAPCSVLVARPRA
jgi:nucleotide-binding universal stress UspA family protein